jgi:molecular chaperone DnaK
MAKSNTIQIGIDLGTTNSAVVVNHKDKYEIVKNSDQMDYTPSVFGYNKGKNLQVGKKAYENLFQFATDDEVKNYKAEIKRLMGTKETIYFERVDQEMSAENISAEILKYLKDAVLRKYPEINTDGVVITVPAYFSTTQKEATKEAGELAGFRHVVLIQEPIAGAMAYGFDNKLNENWLVYDLGGGTFDVAVISSKDGVLTVKGHDGDNYLGGKDFDNLIINKIIIPALQKKYAFDEVSSDSNKTLYNKLKSYAETAKKELTDSEETTIVIDNIKDDDKEEVYLELTFIRTEFEHLISKEIDKSIKLCEKAIFES